MLIELVAISLLIELAILSSLAYYYYFWIPRKHPFEIKGGVLTANDNIISISFKINRNGIVAKNPRDVYVIDQLTGKKLYLLSLPKLGKMTTRKGRRGSYGYMMVANTGQVVKHGSRVTVFIDGYEHKDIKIM